MAGKRKNFKSLKPRSVFSGGSLDIPESQKEWLYARFESVCARNTWKSIKRNIKHDTWNGVKILSNFTANRTEKMATETAIEKSIKSRRRNKNHEHHTHAHGWIFFLPSPGMLFGGARRGWRNFSGRDKLITELGHFTPSEHTSELIDSHPEAVCLENRRMFDFFECRAASKKFESCKWIYFVDESKKFVFN